MTYEQQLKKVRELREQQRLIRLKIARVRRYPAPTTTRAAIKRAMVIIGYMEQYEQAAEQISRLAKTPRYKPGKRSIFNECVSAVFQTAEALPK